MATFTWKIAGGAFDLGSNWTPAGPPGVADVALFNSGSGTISGTGTVATLNLFGAGPWTWTGTVSARNYNLNDAVTLSTGASWVLAGTPTSGNYMVIGSGSGGAGSVTVSNGASIVSSQTASTSNFGLFVGSGSAANATGNLTVTGAGSTVNTGPNGASVGYAGTGVLSLQSGGTAVFSTPDSSQVAALSVAHGAASNGTVNVAGPGSTLTANGFVYVGRGGTAALNVTGGASFTGGSAASGSVAGYGIDIGDSTPASATTQQFGGTGTALVAGGSTLHSLAGLDVGYNGSTGALTVDGAGSLVTVDTGIGVGGGTTRTGAKGTVTIQNGATMRAGTPATGNSSIAIGTGMAGQTGTVTVTGAGSLLDAHGYRLSIGTGTTVTGTATTGASGSLTIANGAHVLSGASYSDTEAALALGVYASGSGTLTISGAGSQLVASGSAVVGGNNSGSGVKPGGTGTINVTGGGLLQTGAMTIFAGSSVAVDQASTLTAPSILISGGTADLYTLSNATAVSFGTGGVLKVHAVTGNSTIANFGFGDQIDFAGAAGATLSGNTVTTATGSITLAPAPANASYQLISDGNGGAFVALEPSTIGVYRFFDSNFGTHFYTADANEAANVRANRPDLVPEGTGGIGLQADAVPASDPNAVAVFRFFDTLHGTHFFTASATERDSVIASRPDLVYEPTSSFYEHATQQPGDVPVYRFFDSVYGTHFYTDSQTEFAAIQSGRPDLTYEGVGFYEPPQNYAPTTPAAM